MLDQPAKARPAKTLEQLDAELEPLHIRPQWHMKDEQLTGGPKPGGALHVWKWPVVYEKLLDACVAMPESFTARRNFSFYNPALSWRGTTPTLVMGIQMVKPGEIAWAHRHTMGALRFVIEGSDRLYTSVDGEVLPMEPNDLVLTPNWTWHDHRNESDANGIWLDVLDVPLVMGLNQGFYEVYGKSVQSLREDRADYVSERAGMLRPAWERRRTENFPYRYPWREACDMLHRMSKTGGTPYDGVLLEYVNPMTGGPALPTMACWLQALPPGFETRPRRRTTSACYYVVEGAGKTIADGVEIEWSARDAFVVPNWMMHRHVNRSPSERVVLFSVTDEPLISRLGLYREEPENTLRRADPPPLPPRPA